MNSASTPRSRQEIFTNQPIVLLALGLAVLYFARVVLIPLAIALTGSFLLAPAVNWIECLRVRRVPAVLLVVAMACTIAGGVGWIVARQVIDVVNDLPNYSGNIHSKLETLHAPTSGPLSRTVNSLREIGAEFTGPTEAEQENPQVFRTWREREQARIEAEKKPIPVTVIEPPETTRQYLAQFVRPVLQPLGILMMVVIFTIYMLLKREDLRNRLLLLAGIGRMNLMTQALSDAAERISRYLVMNVLVNIGYGIVFTIGLYLLHVPNAMLWGTLLAILRMIPYAGTMIAGAATIGFTLAVFPGWWHPLWVLLLFGGLEVLLSNFIEPYIYGSHTGISALALVIMAIVWTLLWGWPGLIVSTPLTVCLIVLGRHVPQLSFLNVLLGEDAELSPDAHFYERLLAMDQQEAHHIADRFLAGRNLVELYDSVIMPALIMTEQDRHKGVLEDVRSTWLFQSVTELVAELADYKSPATIPPPCDPPDASMHARPVVCVPAHDQADEIAATMFAQLLEQCGHNTMILHPGALSTEILTRLAQEPGTIVCISAVLPFAFAYARALTLRLRGSLPENRMVVGLWGTPEEEQVLRTRFGNARPDAVATQFADALNHVRDLKQPAILTLNSR